jgi:predicted alpha-1,2-mannosidase
MSMAVDMMADQREELDASPDIDGSPDADATPDVDMPADMELQLDPTLLTTPEQAYDRVNVWIGTGGQGYAYAALTPAAQAPLGMVKLGPDTTRGALRPRQQHFSGYYDTDPEVRGYSHLHLVGTGVVDYGNVRVIPTTTLEGVADGTWRAARDRAQEAGQPGYYREVLPAHGVTAELTATAQVGLHRYTFAGDGTRYLALDIASSVTDEGVEDAQVNISPDGHLVGWVRYRGGYVGRERAFTLYVDAVASRAPSAVQVWGPDGMKAAGEREAQGERAGGVWAFDGAGGASVELAVGLSMVDAAGAAQNREEQAAGGFDAVRAAAKAAWLERLGRVRVAGGTERQQTIFYTALYNAYRMPSQFSESSGEYRGLDGEVHEAAGFGYYTELSLWDTFRTTHPLYALLEPTIAGDCLRTLVAMGRDGGTIPRWPAALSYTGGMIGTPADALFAEGALKGIGGVDYEEALALLKLTADGEAPASARFKGRDAMAEYVALGYIPVEATTEATSKTLEYGWNDWALANLAEHLGRSEDATRWRARSGGWRLLLHPESGFMQPKMADGSWMADWAPERFYDRGGIYTEGNAWHWRFYPLYDAAALAEALGGPEAMATALEGYLEQSGAGSGRLLAALPDRYYWHGNEIALHNTYMFYAAGRPERLAYWVNRVRERMYGVGADGLMGNDDGGTLSSWYVFSALGFYPVAGSADYIPGDPLFPRAELRLEGGHVVELVASGAPGTARRMVVDGAALGSGELLGHEALVGATRVEFAP